MARLSFFVVGKALRAMEWVWRSGFEAIDLVLEPRE